jgi:hypothetical protein
VEAAPRDRKRLAIAPSRERLRDLLLSPPCLLLAACALLAVGAGIVAFHVTMFTLDESLIEQSAVHYTSDLPHSLLHDVDARATDRLYSLVLSVAFHFFAASNAIRADHVLSVLLFLSAAAPVYLLSRTLLRSRAAAAGAALLSVAVPWLALTSALFTENLAYPLFWWMMLAATRTISAPSRSRDLLTLLSIGLLIVCRAQFAAVFVGYLLALLTTFAWRSPTGSPLWRRVATTGTELARCCTFTILALIALIAILLYERASGGWTEHIEALLGSYSNIVVHKAVPPNMVEALGVEVIALALGVGLLPALVSIVWYARSLGAPVREGRWIVLVGLGVILAVFMVLTVFSQLGYLGALTEERYFFYVIPVFWIGTFAALEDRNVHTGEIALCGLAFAFLYGAIPFLTAPFGQEIAFLAPVESISAYLYSLHSHGLGLGSLTLQDALAAFALIAGIFTALIWRGRPRLRIWWTVGVAAAVQLLFTGYAFAVINGDVPGIAGRTAGNVQSLGWVDAHSAGSRVWWLDNLPQTGAASEAQQRIALFWNSHLTNWAALPATGLAVPTWPMTALPSKPGLSVDQSTGVLMSAVAARQIRNVVSATDSPFVQLAGTPLATSPDRTLTLVQLSQPVRASWLATGLQPAGYVLAGRHVHLHAFLPDQDAPHALRIALGVSGPADATPGELTHTSMVLRFGVQRRLIGLTGSALRQVSVLVCVQPGQGAVAGTLAAEQTTSVDGFTAAGILQSVVTSIQSPALCGR